MCEQRWDVNNVPTGGLEIRPNKEQTGSWEDYCQGKDYNCVVFFFPLRGHDPLSVIAVTVRRQGGWRGVTDRGAELTRQRLSSLGPRLIRELHEAEEEYPRDLTKIQLSLQDAASFRDPPTLMKCFLTFSNAVCPLQADRLPRPRHVFGQLMVELREEAGVSHVGVSAQPRE